MQYEYVMEESFTE